jgi:flagellar biosynthesis/type III secretory pathway protein FliH
MTEDERNDRREGYADGLAYHWQQGRSKAYEEGLEDGCVDLNMMHALTEWKRRAALPVTA